MKISSNPKQQILFRSLNKQLILIIRNFQQFGVSDPEILRFIMEQIFQSRCTSYNSKLSQLQISWQKKNQSVNQKTQNINLVDLIMVQIQFQVPSVKSLLKYVENSYSQNLNLTSEESFISLIQKLPTKTIKNETLNQKLLNNINGVSKNETKINQSIKINNQNSLYRRRQQLFDKEFLFERKTSFERAEENWNEYQDYDDLLKDPFTDQMTLMQQEIARLKELQKIYQQELGAKIVQKRKIIEKLDGPLGLQKISLERVTVVAQTL